jgi:hypothetical protein
MVSKLDLLIQNSYFEDWFLVTNQTIISQLEFTTAIPRRVLSLQFTDFWESSSKSQSAFFRTPSASGYFYLKLRLSTTIYSPILSQIMLNPLQLFESHLKAHKRKVKTINLFFEKFPRSFVLKVCLCAQFCSRNIFCVGPGLVLKVSFTCACKTLISCPETGFKTYSCRLLIKSLLIYIFILRSNITISLITQLFTKYIDKKSRALLKKADWLVSLKENVHSMNEVSIINAKTLPQHLIHVREVCALSYFGGRDTYFSKIADRNYIESLVSERIWRENENNCRILHFLINCRVWTYYWKPCTKIYYK